MGIFLIDDSQTPPHPLSPKNAHPKKIKNASPEILGKKLCHLMHGLLNYFIILYLLLYFIIIILLLYFI